MVYPALFHQPDNLVADDTVVGTDGIPLRGSLAAEVARVARLEALWYIVAQVLLARVRYFFHKAKQSTIAGLCHPVPLPYVHVRDVSIFLCALHTELVTGAKHQRLPVIRLDAAVLHLEAHHDGEWY